MINRDKFLTEVHVLDQTGEKHSISHLVGAGNEARKLVLFFLLSFNHCLHDARMVGTKVDEAMSDAGLPFLLRASFIFSSCHLQYS